MPPSFRDSQLAPRLVVAGSDALAARLVEELAKFDGPGTRGPGLLLRRRSGQPRGQRAVAALVNDEHGPFVPHMRQFGAAIRVGVASDAATLRDVGVGRARAIALLDVDDVANLHAALVAREINPDVRLVIRMFNPRLAERIQRRFHDCTVLSSSTIAAPSFVDAALGDGQQLVEIAGDVLNAGPPASVQQAMLTLVRLGPNGPELLPAEPTETVRPRTAAMWGGPSHLARPHDGTPGAGGSGTGDGVPDAGGPDAGVLDTGVLDAVAQEGDTAAPSGGVASQSTADAARDGASAASVANTDIAGSGAGTRADARTRTDAGTAGTAGTRTDAGPDAAGIGTAAPDPNTGITDHGASAGRETTPGEDQGGSGPGSDRDPADPPGQSESAGGDHRPEQGTTSGRGTPSDQSASTDGNSFPRPVLVLGPPARPVVDAPPAARDSRPRRARRRRTPGSWSAVLTSAGRWSSRRLRWALGTLVGLIAAGTVIFRQGLRLGWLDALYTTVSTVTTGGPSGIDTAPSSLKLFTAGAMLLGVVLMALITAFAVDDLVVSRLTAPLGVPVGRTSGHVIVCGLGTVGLRMVEHLCAAGVPVVGVDRDPDAATAAAVRRLGVPVVRGDASEEETLQTAGIDRAFSVVAATDDDVANIESALAIWALRNDVRIVLRLFNSELAARITPLVPTAITLSVSAAAAPVFAAAMVGREVLAPISTEYGVLLVAEVPVATDSEADNAPLALLDVPGSARVFGLRTTHEGNRLVLKRPSLDHILKSGDDVFIVATQSGLASTLGLTTTPE